MGSCGTNIYDHYYYHLKGVAEKIQRYGGLMTLLSPSGLETLDYASPAWNYIADKNFELLAQKLLKLNELQGVLTTGLAAGAVLVWDGSSWVPRFWS